MGPKDLLLNGLQKGKPPIPHELRSALKKLKERELLLLQNYVNACSDTGYQEGVVAAGGRLGV
jgi:hypothetical protein